MEFQKYTKIARLSREMVITEKIDGTNGVIYIGENGEFLVGSRNNWITPENDNFGFARWCQQNKDDLLKLGTGYHYGEWYGVGIQRGYYLSERRFALFNIHKWSKMAVKPICCHCVPVLYTGMFDTIICDDILAQLKKHGSYAVPGYMNPEGMVIFHKASGCLMKKTIENDDAHKADSK